MKKILLFIFPLFFTHLHAGVPVEIEEFAKSANHAKAHYGDFKEDVLKTISMLKKLELFVKRDTYRVYSSLDNAQERVIRDTIAKIQAVLSNGPILPLLGNDPAIKKEIEPFYSVCTNPTPNSPDDREAVDPDTLEKIKDLCFPSAKQFYLQTQSAHTMHNVLDDLFDRHITLANAGSLIVSSDPVEILDLRDLSHNMMRHVLKNFWWGEMLLVYHYKGKTSSLRETWEHQALDWVGQGKKSDAPQTLEEISGLAETLRLQSFTTFSALFLHQLSTYHMNGWSLEDLKITFPRQRNHLKALEENFLGTEPALLPTSKLTHHVNLLDRLNEYTESSIPLLRGVFSYDDAHSMLESVELYLSQGHAITISFFAGQAHTLVEDLQVTKEWNDLQQLMDAEQNKVSANMFEQARIQERKNRYLRFDPTSIAESTQELLERKKQFLEFCHNPLIQEKFRASPLFSVFSYRNLLSRIFDLLVDSYPIAVLSTQNMQEKTMIEKLFRTVHLAIQESDRQVVNHAFLFLTKHPGILDDTSSGQSFTSGNPPPSRDNTPKNGQSGDTKTGYAKLRT